MDSFNFDDILFQLSSLTQKNFSHSHCWKIFSPQKQNWEREEGEEEIC
jgi:hypothetical protein